MKYLRFCVRGMHERKKKISAGQKLKTLQMPAGSGKCKGSIVIEMDPPLWRESQTRDTMVLGKGVIKISKNP